MKKMLAIWLCLCLLLAAATPVFAAETQEARPMIYIEGQGIYLYRDDGTLVYDRGISIMDRLMENSADLVKYALLNGATGYYKPFCDLMYETVVPVYEAEALGKDGMPRDGSHVYPGNMWRGQGSLDNIRTTIPLSGGKTYPVYRWHFDWRLSPITLAEELRDLIDAVLEESGAQQVDLVSRCISTNIVYAYLYLYGPEKVHTSVFYASSLYGIGAAEAMFTGDVVIDPDAAERFLIQYREQNNLVVRDEETTDLLFALLSLVNEMKLLGLGIDNLTHSFDKMKSDVLVRILRETFATFPSYWSMVGADKYEAARAFVFGDVQDEWAGLLEKTDAYYEMQKQIDDYLLSISDKVRIGFVVKYSFPCFPLSADASEESDTYVTVRRASCGATAADVDKTLSDAYLRTAIENSKGRYLSADRKIDASTALFPDTTWYVKDLYHTYFPDCVNSLIVDFVNNDSMTVFTDPAYTPFLQFRATNNMGSDYTTGVLTPIRSMADTYDGSAHYQHTFWQVQRNFFRALGAFMKSLFVRSK